METIKVGDKVEVRKSSRVVLRSSSNWYHHAEVHSISPFVLKSVNGDMTWSQLDPNDFILLGLKTAQYNLLMKWLNDELFQEKLSEAEWKLIRNILNHGYETFEKIKFLENESIILNGVRTLWINHCKGKKQ